MKSRWIKTSNGRLLYRVSRDHCRDWKVKLLEVDAILKNSSLQRVDDFIYFYYFLPADSPEFLSTESWIAREVAGYLDESCMYDLDASFLWQTFWTGKWSDFHFTNLWQWEKETRASLKQPVDTWRLQILTDKVGSLSASLHHFPRKKEERDYIA